MTGLRTPTVVLAMLAVAALTGSDAAPAPSALPFDPTPKVCFHGIQPPPCDYPVVSTLFGALHLDTLVEFGGSGSPSSVGQRPRFPNQSGNRGGEYEALAWDSRDQPVDGVVLDMAALMRESDSAGVDVFVNIYLPGTAGVSRVEFRMDGRTLGTWTAGPSAPRFTSVTATATDEGIQVAWEASDPEADPLVFAVSVIASDGTASASKTGLRGFTTMITNTKFRGPGPYRVRVDASDGINLAWAVSGKVEGPVDE